MSTKSIVILMGVSGCGKTTIGRLLAERLGWPFYDGDDFQPQGNLDRMTQGIALSDDDRRPWLKSLHNLLAGICSRNGRAVLACSALKQDYRDLLIDGLAGIRLVYLKGEYGVLETRLKARQGHYFKAGLLASQFEILEEPPEAFIVHVDNTPGSIVDHIRAGLSL